MPKLARYLFALLMLTVTGCGENNLSPTAPHFEGLDPAVVSEVLSHPAALRMLEQTQITQKSLAQGITINFMVCRDAMRAYQEWITTGLSPTLNPLPEPVHPQPYSYSDWIMAYEELIQAAQSGDPEQLLKLITGQYTCGRWIPAEPGNFTGPTIEDVLLGR